MHTHRSAFPDFPAAEIPAEVFGPGWVDTSNPDEATPSWLHQASGLRVFIDRECQAARAHPAFTRFAIFDESRAPYNDTPLESDAWAEIMDYLAAHPA